jgi:hypothetical protein
MQFEGEGGKGVLLLFKRVSRINFNFTSIACADSLEQVRIHFLTVGSYSLFNNRFSFQFSGYTDDLYGLVVMVISFVLLTLGNALGILR